MKLKLEKRKQLKARCSLIIVHIYEYAMKKMKYIMTYPFRVIFNNEP